MGGHSAYEALHEYSMDMDLGLDLDLDALTGSGSGRDVTALVPRGHHGREPFLGGSSERRDDTLSES